MAEQLQTCLVYCPVAQKAERLTENEKVIGPKPIWAAFICCGNVIVPRVVRRAIRKKSANKA